MPLPAVAQRRFTITAKLAVIVVAFVAVIAALVAVMVFSLRVAAGVRAYVGGEGLWSKGQKDAVYYLQRYVITRNEVDFAKYREAIAIPLGDHQARIEMLKPVYDYGVVERGFVQGLNAAEDVPNLAFVFRSLRAYPYLDKGIGIWTAAEDDIYRLIATGDELHEAVVAGRLAAAQEGAFLDRIEQVNSRLTPKEQEFSRTLGEGSRAVGALLRRIIYLTAALLLAAGLWVSWRISSGLRGSIAALREGAQRVGAGDLGHAIVIGTRDELGELAAAFNDMMAHRKDAEAALEKEREFLKSVLESLTEGIVACDEGGTLTLFNRATREMHGLPEAPLAPDQWAEHYDLYLADGTTRMPTKDVPLFRAFGGEMLHDVEIVIAPKGLPRRVLLCNGRPIVTAQGRKLGAVVALHDITGRKQAERALEERAAELQRSNEELERFAYVASHDLQEPLRTLASYTELLTRRFGEQVGPGADEYAHHIVEAVHRMRSLIEGLLGYSRVSQAAQKFESMPLDPLLDAALANLQESITTSAAVIARDPLPTLRVIPHLVTQLLQNLVGNAIKFHGREPPRIEIKARREGACWRFSVKDNGIGIEPQFAERIFVLFQRLHTQDQYPGSGIGLAMCKKIVERHGGRIWVERVERGSEFCFTLPA